jgi:hypothetical protein
LIVVKSVAKSLLTLIDRGDMGIWALVLYKRRLNCEPKLAPASRNQTREMISFRFNDSTNHVATARHMSERVFYPDTNDVSSASKVVRSASLSSASTL